MSSSGLGHRFLGLWLEGFGSFPEPTWVVL